MLPPILQLGLETRLRHVLVVGKTGTGKSTLLRAVAAEDVAAGRGLLLIDPHGDLAEAAIAHVPRGRKNDLLRIDAADPASCPGLNPFQIARGAPASLLVSNLLSSMKKTWPEAWGPRTEHVLRHVLLALSEVRGATLVDAQRLLVEDKHREWVVRQVKDAHVRRFFERELGSYGKKLLPEVVAPILNKLGALVGNANVRALVTKGRPRLDARAAMDRNRIVVASLPKGRIGEDSALLLGGVLIGALQAATMERAALAPERRTPFFLFVDEVGSFASAPLLDLLAEGRKYGVGLVLATQSLAAMEDDVRARILANVGTLVAFRVGADDAELLSREMTIPETPKLLMRFEVGQAAVRTGSEPPAVVSLPAP